MIFIDVLCSHKWNSDIGVLRTVIATPASRGIQLMCSFTSIIHLKDSYRVGTSQHSWPTFQNVSKRHDFESYWLKDAKRRVDLQFWPLFSPDFGSVSGTPHDALCFPMFSQPWQQGSFMCIAPVQRSSWSSDRCPNSLDSRGHIYLPFGKLT